MSKPTIIDYLVKNEELLSQLYKFYSQKYSSHADFWGRLSDDEKAHAEKIQKIAEGNSKEFSKKRFDEKNLQSFTLAIEKEINSFKEKDLDVKQALASALKLEKMLVSSKFFEADNNDSEDLRAKLEDIAESVDKHNERIAKMIERA